jgi:hypothetical protein
VHLENQDHPGGKTDKDQEEKYARDPWHVIILIENMCVLMLQPDSAVFSYSRNGKWFFPASKHKEKHFLLQNNIWKAKQRHQKHYNEHLGLCRLKLAVRLRSLVRPKLAATRGRKKNLRRPSKRRTPKKQSATEGSKKRPSKSLLFA